MQTSNRIKYNYEIFFCFQPCVRRGKRLLSGFFFMRTFLENAQFHNNWLVLIQTNNWVQFIRQFSNKLLISFNLDLWKIMKLLFLLLFVCPDFISISTKSVLISGFNHSNYKFCFKNLITFCHRKYLNCRIVYSSCHHGTFNQAVITNKEVHIVQSDSHR